MTPFGIYVHVPFCSALCPYCDFAVVVGKRDLHARYCDALVAEVSTFVGAPQATSMFIGGGTPTFVDGSLLASTIPRIQAYLPLEPDAEVTVEANPESVSPSGVRELRAVGVNRISIGAQSFRPDVLRSLGRTHSVDQIDEAVHSARAAGFDNVSLDLIYGGPGESTADWRTSLEGAIALGVDHVSCYALTIEDRTQFGRAVARGQMAAPDDDTLAAKYELAIELLDASGFRHYEISNWARPGFESRHNMLYWTQGEYVGLGVGAHSHRDEVRWWNTRSLHEYLEHPEAAREAEERLDAGQRAEEWLSLRMRLLEGLNIDEAEARLDAALGPVVEELRSSGLVQTHGNVLRLVPSGMLLENEVTLKLLSARGSS